MASSMDKESKSRPKGDGSLDQKIRNIERFSKKKPASKPNRPFSATDIMLLKPYDEEEGHSSARASPRKELLKKYLRPRSVSFHPDVRLFYASTTNDLNEVKTLIEAGMADVNAKNPAEGASALHGAAFEGNDECVTYLLQSGARVNSRDDDGWTPLHAAVCGKNIKCVELLLEAKSNSFAENSDGYTPFQMAIELRDEKLLSCFFKYIGDMFGDKTVPETCV
ncbi:protein phosphatase 1 regulatory subunit 27-like [Actinia tenebrosa]|uniref:Protein phosphatase 1 regulatory subunit 27-like n=1 Tax=Actinia tenebrosa TaxID=6105 RepID=A0A6P8JBM4_ACTTE|nr:protein phosphatase 1 regulatory subunit 27-like [Actinia tenebrosa]